MKSRYFNLKSNHINLYTKKKKYKRPLKAKLKSLLIGISFIILIISVASLSAYSLIMTQFYKQTKPMLQVMELENKKKQNYIEKYTILTEKISKDLCTAVDKNNELRQILGVEEIKIASLETARPKKIKTEKDIITHNEFVNLLKNIKTKKNITGNMEIGQILIGDQEILSFVTPKDTYYGAHYRTNHILQRIRKIIYDREVYDKIVIKELEKDEYGILINKKLLFTVTQYDADFTKTDIAKLARKRARSFHNALVDFNKNYILAYIKKKLETNKNNAEKKSVSQKLNNLTSVLEQLTEKSEGLETTTRRYYQRYKSTPSIVPLKGTISSGFGYRKSPFTGKLKLHEGIDISAMTGTPVKATADGYITRAGWYIGYGYFVQINHGYGIETRYGHLSKINVKKGQFVKKGKTVAFSGNTGLSTGPHLHYEIRNFKKPINPRKYMNLDIYSVKNRW